MLTWVYKVTYEVLLEEVVRFTGFITIDSHFAYLGFNPIPSTPSVGYGTALYTSNGPFGQGKLRGAFTVLPEHRRDVMDVAYVVANRGFSLIGGVYTGDNTFEWSDGLVVDVVLPDPGTAWLFVAVTAIVLMRSRRLTCLSRSLNHAASPNPRCVGGNLRPNHRRADRPRRRAVLGDRWSRWPSRTSGRVAGRRLLRSTVVRGLAVGRQ